jgi:Fur family ferric uptake transcriptional regulator
MSTDDIHNFRQIIANNGYRLTDAREATFRLLVSSEPQSVRELLKKAYGSIDRVSVYRSLSLFEKLGIVHRIYVGWKYKLELSDEFVEHHHHLSCLDCGKVIDIQDEKHIDEFIDSVAAKVGFKPRRHQFEVDGYCKECALKR